MPLLLLPNFRYRQKAGSSQDVILLAKDLKERGYWLHGHAIYDLRNKPRATYWTELKPYIANLVIGFEGVIDSWDVCIEVSDHNKGLWGDDWQVEMFEYMRELCPEAKLWLNEYAINNQAYWEDSVLPLAERLNSLGLVDGVGIQCQTDIRKRTLTGIDVFMKELIKPIPTPRLDSAISAIKSMGLPVHLSEVNCVHDSGQENAAEGVIERYVSAAKRNSVERLTYWKLPQAQSSE